MPPALQRIFGAVESSDWAAWHQQELSNADSQLDLKAAL